MESFLLGRIRGLDRWHVNCVGGSAERQGKKCRLYKNVLLIIFVVCQYECR